MHTFTNLAIGAVLLSTAAAQNTTNGTPSDSTITCADGLKMFVSRGTGEAPGTGVTGKLADLIASQIDGSDVQGIAYPATFENPDYSLSVSNGTRLLKQSIIDYSQACTDSKIALFGYSQVCRILPQNSWRHISSFLPPRALKSPAMHYVVNQSYGHLTPPTV